MMIAPLNTFPGHGNLWIQCIMSENTPLLGSAGGPSTGEPVPKYTEGAVEETHLDRFDEQLYGKARELEFGDWNVSRTLVCLRICQC